MLSQHFGSTDEQLANPSDAVPWIECSQPVDQFIDNPCGCRVKVVLWMAKFRAPVILLCAQAICATHIFIQPIHGMQRMHDAKCYQLIA